MIKKQKRYWASFYWRKIYLKYFFKYMTGFMGILLPCILILLFSWTTTREQVITAGQLRFQEGMEEISFEISKMRILENDIRGNSSFNVLSNVEGEIPWGSYMNLYQANNQLEDIRFIYEFSPFVFVLFENNDLFVSSQQCDENFSEWYYSILMEAQLDGSVLEAQEFRDIVLSNTKEIYSFTRLDSIFYYTDRKKELKENPILCVVNSATGAGTGNRFGMCYVILQETLVDMLLMEECKEDGFIQITDAKGNILLDYGNTEAIADGSDAVVDIGSHWIFSTTDTEETFWQVKVGMPKAVISKQMHVLYKVIYTYVFLGILMVILLSFYFGRKQCSELIKFYSLIPEWEKKISEEQNEYEALVKIFQNMVEDSENYLKYKADLEKQNQAIRLEKLIAEGISTQEEREELKRAGMISSDFYCMAIMRMQVKGEMEYSLTLIGLKEYLQRNWPDKIFHIHMGVYDEMFVFSMPNNSSPDVTNVQKLFVTASRILSSEMDVVINVGISTIGMDLANLKRCYNQAYQVLEAYYHEDKNAVNYYNIAMDHSKKVIISMEFLNQFNQCVLHRNTEGIRKSFLFVKSFAYKQPVYFEAQKEQLFYSIRNLIYNAMLNFGEEPDETGMLPLYDKADSVDGMCEKLQNAAEWIVQQIDSQKKAEKQEFWKEILDFLERNYGDKNMSVNYMCAEFGISERYLQTVIREKTGDTFAVYLEKFRIKQAVELLMHTSLSNEQIADEVGFVAISTFYRVFNKRMGMSPKAFREE